ncbi:hypothetical protein KIL84_023459 [Mauremys mutica]|uniref:Uncharacterized protein n=1 Tax=Mauremys mutica TaxID=74926 RepID=A0A9D4ARP7_9SAUR|nr:hypothetical protein KIL84_023459 [Mauremys mutica]
MGAPFGTELASAGHLSAWPQEGALHSACDTVPGTDQPTMGWRDTPNKQPRECSVHFLRPPEQLARPSHTRLGPAPGEKQAAENPSPLETPAQSLSLSIATPVSGAPLAWFRQPAVGRGLW